MRLEDALPVAEELREAFAIASERCEIAGSIRRRRPDVKDIEIVAIPRWVEEPVGLPDLFGAQVMHRMNLLQRGIEGLEAAGVVQVIKPGVQDVVPWQLKAEGKYWRLFVPDANLKVDVFLPTPRNWGLALMIRTGSGTGPSGTASDGFAPGMLARWKKITGGGYSEEMTLHGANGFPYETPEEQTVFDLCQVEYIEPAFRNSSHIIQQRAR